ncbi:MAG: sulfite exporter TauE/SafE family protein [Acidimicrobiia bacterium]
MVVEADLVVVGIAGFFAAMVDGALGMGFGPTSSSILLSQGLSPATVSTTVNLAKVATGLVAGVAHWRFNNIDRRLVVRLAIPGSIGALIGVTVLASVDGDDLKPFLAVLLLLVGIRILVRFSRPLPLAPDTPGAADTEATEDAPPTFDERGVEIAAAAGGITNGLVGAWGPVVTPYLLHRGLTPRFAVGSVNTAEVAVAIVSAGSLVASLGGGGLDAEVVLAMLGGGVAAAPLAAYVVRFLPARLLGLTVAALLLLTNIRELAGSWELHDWRWSYYVTAIALVALAMARPRLTRGVQARRGAD